MSDPTWAATLLSLATSYDKACAIEGDLREEAHSQGRVWFVWHVLRTTAALLCASSARDAGRVALLGFAVHELALKLNWWVVGPVRSPAGRSDDLCALGAAGVRNRHGSDAPAARLRCQGGCGRCSNDDHACAVARFAGLHVVADSVWSSAADVGVLACAAAQSRAGVAAAGAEQLSAEAPPLRPGLLSALAKGVWPDYSQALRSTP
jgi:hypothetical protein